MYILLVGATITTVIFISQFSPPKFPFKFSLIIPHNGGSFINEQWCLPQLRVYLVGKVHFTSELALRVNSHGKHKDICDIVISQYDGKKSSYFDNLSLIWKVTKC